MTPQDLGRKWVPKDAVELLDAFNGGLLAETHWCDLKAELGSNRESAKDMSAFSIDGGTIVIGIDEKKPEGEPRHPVTLKGLPEKLEQIAQMSIHPPLQISCTTIESGDDDGKGYLLVNIPASALAPHQVDSVYYARSDVTTIRMSEPEVERLYQRRVQWTRGVDEMLKEYVGSDPFIGAAILPHLFIVARPVGGWPEMSQDLVSGKNLRSNFNTLTNCLETDDFLRATRERIGRGRERISSIIGALPAAGGTLAGAMLSTRMRPPSLENARPDAVTDLELSEDGELWFYRSGAGRIVNPDYSTTPHFEIEYMVLAVREVIRLAREISARYGHAAMWDFGLAVTGLRGTRPFLPNHGPLERPEFPGAEYSRTTRANVLELEKTPGAVTQRLAGGLYRVFSMEDRHLMAVFDDEAPSAG